MQSRRIELKTSPIDACGPKAMVGRSTVRVIAFGGMLQPGAGLLSHVEEGGDDVNMFRRVGALFDERDAPLDLNV